MGEEFRELEQNQEEIVRILAEAIEAGKEVVITQITSGGQEVQESATPISIDGNVLLVESYGYGFGINIGEIKEVKI